MSLEPDESEMSVNDRLQAVTKEMDETLKLFEPASVPPNEAAQVAEELRRTQQKLARYNEAYEQQRKREGKTPTE
jgi:hypothetical protein